jgi:hypothetical protein
MEAKVNYIKRNLNRQTFKEDAFPLLLHYNYSDVMWPRCELLMERGDKNFALEKVLPVTDAQFCSRYGFTAEELTAKKGQRKFVEETDKLWVYIPGL